MAIEVGKRYYFIVHAYHHVIATVTAVTGKRECDMTDVRWIYSCARNWTQFFRDGALNDTVCHIFPPGHNVSFTASFEWPHSLPEPKQ